MTTPLLIEPDGAFLLEGAQAEFKLMDKGVDAEGKVDISELNVTSEDADYRFEVAPGGEEIIQMETLQGTVRVTALKQGEAMVRSH